MEMIMTRAQATSLLKALSGDAPGVFISFDLIKKVGDLQTAAYVSQAAWLSANATNNDGWFFLDQKGSGAASKEGIYKKLGSWQQGLGITEHAQKAIRTLMIKNGWLCERPSASGIRRGEKINGNGDTAFLFTQRQGTPPRLHYHVDLPRYLRFLTFDDSTGSKPDDPEISLDNPLAAYQVIDSKDKIESMDLNLQIHGFKSEDPQIQNDQFPDFVYKTESADGITTATLDCSTVASSTEASPEQKPQSGGGEIDGLVEAAYWQQCQIESPRNPSGWRATVRRRMVDQRVTDDDRDTHKRWKRFQKTQAQAQRAEQEAAQQAAAREVLQGEDARKRALAALSTLNKKKAT